MAHKLEQVRRIAPTSPTVALALGGRELPGKPGGWAVTVEFSNGGRMRFDRADDERAWYLAAQVSPNGFPVREHGDLSRCTLLAQATDELAAELDEAVLLAEGATERARLADVMAALEQSGELAAERAHESRVS